MNEEPPDTENRSQDQPPTEEEIERLQAERDALEAQLERIKRSRLRRTRSFIVVPLVLLSAIFILLSVTVVWAHRTVLNTDEFVGTVGPVFQDPGVDRVVATRTANELFDELHIQSRVADALPPKIGFAAVPITNASKGFVTDQLTKVFASPNFQKFWTNTLRTTHEQVVAVLRGHSTKALSTANGYIVLNTVPVINQALGKVSGLVSNLTGKNVKLPTITSAELPQQAVDKLSKALGVQLPRDFGQVTLVKSSSIDSAQKLVRAFDRFAILLPLLTIVLITLGLWLSVARRRSLIQLLVVALLLLIAERRIVIYAQSDLAKKAQNPDVAERVLGQLLHGFYVLSAWVVGIEVAILVIALITGPYRWAQALRQWVVQGAGWVADQFNAERRERTIGLISSHANVVQFVAAGVAFVVLLIVSVSWLSFLIVGILLAAFELWVQRLKPPPGEEAESEGPETAADSPSHAGSAP
jgi:hypothetical protein